MINILQILGCAAKQNELWVVFILRGSTVFACNQLQKGGLKQRGNNNVRARGKGFRTGELVWECRSRRRKGRWPKLECHWVRLGVVLEKMAEVVYRVQQVALHRDGLCSIETMDFTASEWTSTFSLYLHLYLNCTDEDFSHNVRLVYLTAYLLYLCTCLGYRCILSKVQARRECTISTVQYIFISLLQRT